MTDPPVVVQPVWDLHDIVRAVVITVALVAITALAFVGDSTIRPQAATALITLLAAAAGYLFRGRVITDTPVTATVNNVK